VWCNFQSWVWLLKLLCPQFRGEIAGKAVCGNDEGQNASVFENQGIFLGFTISAYTPISSFCSFCTQKHTAINVHLRYKVFTLNEHKSFRISKMFSLKCVLSKEWGSIRMK
jgi:hypothetical protein